MKRWLALTLIILAALAVLVAAVVLTPVGHEPARRILEDVVRDATGFELAVADISGNLLTRIVAADVRLSSAGGEPLVEVDEVVIEYELLPLLDRTVSVPLLRLENARTWFTVNEEGRLLGWTDVPPDTAAAEPDTAAPSEPWTISANVLFDGLEAVYADSGASLSVTADLERLSAEGGIDAFDAAFEGRVLYEGAPLARPLEVELSVDGGFADGTVRVSSLELMSDPADISASGSLAFPPEGMTLDVALTSEMDAGALSALFGTDAASGLAELDAEASGPVGSLSYEASVRSDSLLIAAIPFESVSGEIEGTGGRVSISSLTGRALDGSFRVCGTADLTGPAGGRVSFDASGENLSLSRVPGADLSGAASLGATGEMPLERMTAASGTLSVSVRGFGAGDLAFGDASVRARVDDGSALVSAFCCSTSITAEARLVESGAESLSARVEAGNLTRLGQVFGLDSLEGRASVDVRARSLRDAPLRYTARFPELGYLGVNVGPVEIDGSAEKNVHDISWAVLDGVAKGTAVIDLPEARYAVVADVDGLELSDVVSDSLTEPYDAEATVTLTAEVEGAFAGGFAASGRVSALDGRVRGENLTLEEPFSFEATTAMVTLAPVHLSGSLGSFSVGGTVTAGDSLDIEAELRDLDLAAVDRMARGRVRGPGMGGLVSGSLDVSGTRRAPVATLDISADSLSAAGVSFEETTIEADVDSTMVIFALSAATSEEGALRANGLVPVRPDTATFLALDTDREFALSLAAESFSAEVGDLVLTGTRGPKDFRIDGSLLVTGLMDSLASLNGRGELNELALSLAPARMALADTFSFEIDAGDVWLDGLTVDVTRTRVLTEAAGGRMHVSGFVGVRDSVDISARLDSLDMATLFRVVSPGPTAPVAGRLDLTANVRGRLSAPSVEARWAMTEPRLAGVGFDGFVGRVHAEGQRIIVDRATLSSAGDSLTVSGSIGAATGRPPDAATGGGEGAPAARPLDLSVRTDGIALGNLSPLPPGVERLGGILTADVAVGGTTAEPSFSGSVKLAQGLFRGYGMVDPARAVEVEVAALGRSFSIAEAAATLGSGDVSLDGSYDMDSNGSFRFRARLNSPEIRIEETLDARLGGKVTWAGDGDRSSISGEIDIEEANVFYEFNIAELASRRVKRVSVRAAEDPRSRVGLDLEINVDDVIEFDSNLADLELAGGIRIAGTLLRPRPTGSFFTESGTFQYLGTEFDIETLNVSWRDPRRSDPYISLVADAEVDARSGDSYSVTVRFDDYWYDGTFSFTSTPPLSEPDIIALLTFGDTVGGVVSGGDRPGTSRSSFSELARKTFVGRVFGVAEATLEDLLDLDVVAIEEETTEEGSLVAGAGVTVGKRFGRVAVSYTTAVGRFEEREVEVSFFLTEHLSLVTRADPGGNHAAHIRLHIPIQ